MSAKHTPGPWKIALDDKIVKSHGDDSWQPVATPTGPRFLRRGDAHLIAAAPDMLEALEMYHRAASTIPYAQWTTEMHKADAAIKKARGEK